MGFAGGMRAAGGYAADYLIAEASLLAHGPLPPALVEERLVACRGCERLQRRPEAPVGYCAACGCREWARAELTVKASMPAATCPLRRWAKPGTP